MADLTLYHASPSRSSIVLWMLEELGQPYDIQLLSLSKGENRAPDYLAVNPMGKVPALRHRDTAITEVAAICTYLADEFPNAKLNVPIGTPRRGEGQGTGGANCAGVRRVVPQARSSRQVGFGARAQLVGAVLALLSWTQARRSRPVTRPVTSRILVALYCIFRAIRFDRREEL